MKRREVIKLGSAMLTSASLGAFAGYSLNKNNNKTESLSSFKAVKIEPKQTAQYEYSFPMPYNKKLIDELAELNNKLLKGKIIYLTSSIPLAFGENVHYLLACHEKEANNNIKSFEEYLDFIDYAIKKGFKCICALNTTAPFWGGDESFYKKVLPLFRKLNEIGVGAIQLANSNLIHAFYYEIPNLKIHLSTVTQYHNIQTYINLLKAYPNIEQFNVAVDDNHNFTFLMSLKKLFPSIKIGVLVNEINCIKNCPAIFFHAGAETLYPCEKIIKDNPILHLTRNNLIHPWQLGYYSAIGINNFNFTVNKISKAPDSINSIKYYAQCAESGFNQLTANDYLEKIYCGSIASVRFNKNLSLKELAQNLPDITKLIKKGERCASDCETKCRYCYDCAEKVKELTLNS